MGSEKRMGEDSKRVMIGSDVGSIFVPKTISDVLTEVSMILDFSQKLSKLDFYIHSFEEEMRKIHVFKRELPLSMHLLKDAIETLKKERLMWEEERERETVPVTEEFIPLKSDSSSDDRRVKPSNHNTTTEEAKNWMSSLHLWITPVQYEENTLINYTSNQDSVFSSKSKCKEEESSESNCIFKNRDGGAFSPFKKPSVKEDKNGVPKVNGGLTLSIPAAAADVAEPTVIATAQDSNTVKETPPQSFTIKPKPNQDEQQRKQRRCWSPELHRIFIDALQQLGGAEVATPKQIRELMKVEGLTNDEVKSHLQKYRLHVRKVPRAAAPAPMMVGMIPWFRQGYEHGEPSDNNRTMPGSFGSPQQHLHDIVGGSSSAAQGGSSTTTTEGDIIEEADDDEKSKSYSWKGKSAEHPF